MKSLHVVCVAMAALGACGDNTRVPRDLTPRDIAPDEGGLAIPPSEPRTDVLVIVNDNSRSSAEVGEYYAENRQIPARYVAHVQVRPNYFITLDEFRSLRDQVIRFLQENTLDDPVLEPVVCEDGESRYYCEASIEQIRNHSTIRYVVTTKGVPSRFIYEGSPLAYSNLTSVDNYLRHWLVNYYDRDVRFTPTERPKAFGDGRGMRTVAPATDGELIIGRLDGITTEAARNLVDRALAAEANGVFGKLYSSRFEAAPIASASTRFYDHDARKLVYGTPSTEWLYQVGLFGDLFTDGVASGIRHTDEPTCLTHLEESHTTAAGKTPQECVTRLTTGSDPPPATTNSRQPWVDDALIYLGSLDGQPTTGSFDRFRYWRKDDQCGEPLCADTSDPEACSASSTDVFGEVNTACMGVADGFIGYNLQSYPVSFFAVWPTGWVQSTSNTTWSHRGGGDVKNLSLPEVRTDVGFDDTYSLWFGNSDAVEDPMCFEDTEAIAADALSSCIPDARRVVIYNRVTFAPRQLDVAEPQQYTVRFRYRVEDSVQASDLRVTLFAHELGAGNDQVTVATVTLGGAIVEGSTTAVPGNDNGWVEAVATFTLDPADHGCAAPCTDVIEIDGLKLRIETPPAQDMQATLGLDAFTLEENHSGTITPIDLSNPTFDDGHREVSGGDHAANFLSRLNGTAFWGSMSHHESGGHSFEQHIGETLIYFLRGLPLGDAVWFAENHNSGVFYGDPLYSPIAVRFDYNNSADWVGGDSVRLSGSAINGSDRSEVTTHFEIDYCPGDDFFACDQTSSWVPTGLAGDAGWRQMTFGHWDASSLSDGPYTLRLAVTSHNASKGKEQTFYDYYPVTVYDRSADPDMDGLTSGDEVDVHGTDPTMADTDSDGASDGVEVTQGTDPLVRTDDDADGMSDHWELANGLDPTSDDAADDLDGDGAPNIIELLRGTAANDSDSTPPLAVLHVDSSSSTGIEDGSVANPFLTVQAAVLAAQAGDEVRVHPGSYDLGFYFLGKSIRLAGEGPGVVIAGISLFIGNAVWGEVESLHFDLQSLFIYNVRNLLIAHSHFDMQNDVSVYGGAELEMSQTALVGGGSNEVSIQAASVVLRHLTILDFATGISATPQANVSLTNSILENGDDIAGLSNDAARYNLIADGELAWIGGNLPATAEFQNRAGGDLRLLPSSPGIDTGDPNAPYAQEPGLNGARANAGAFGNTADAAVGTDTDSDGIPDGWENIAGTNPAVADSDDDPDGDGFTNAAEFAAGSNPNDAMSTP